MSGRAFCASMRPLAVYIYSFGSQSCTDRLGLNRSAPLRRRNKPRMAPCSRSAARPSSFFGLVVPQPLAAAWPPAPCIRHLRRDTSSAGYRHPCLACICRCSSRTGRAALAPAVRLPLEAACTSEAMRFSSFLLRVVGLSRLRLAAVMHCENPLRKFLSRFIILLSKIKTPKGLGIPRAKRVREADALAGVRVPTRLPLAVAPDAGDHMPPRL